jgi:4-hydroxybenzoate polyprenyltransferase
MSHLWFPLLLIILAGSTSSLKASAVSSLYLFFVVLCKVMFSIQINDICDKKEDDAAGKTRWIGYLPKYWGIIISIFLAAAGLTTVTLASGSMKVILSYTATLLLGLLYSLRPVRFKERGIWGLFSYALAATIIYVLVPWTWFDSSWILLIFLFVTVMSDKWVQLNFHQIVDYHADLKNETQTFAVRAGLKRTRSILQSASLFASFSMLSVLIYAMFFVIQEKMLLIIILVMSTATVAASGIYVRILNKKTKSSSDLVKELPWIYLGLTYLLFCVLPPVGFIFLALKEPLMWILVVLSTSSLLGISLHSVSYKYS